jgi:hypothetical protein
MMLMMIDSEWTMEMEPIIKNLDYTLDHSGTSSQDNTESLLDGLQTRFSYMGGYSYNPIIDGISLSRYRSRVTWSS